MMEKPGTVGQTTLEHWEDKVLEKVGEPQTILGGNLRLGLMNLNFGHHYSEL
jgi:hypothetical protein